jgi:hypothetical protein
MSDNIERGSGPADLHPDLPKWDIVGPTVEDDLRRVISRYGVEAVRKAAAKLAKAQRGRPKVDDLDELKAATHADAHDWLEGRNPYDLRSDYSIAKEIADKKPGQSHPATMKRILRKLKNGKSGGRRFRMLAIAEHLGSEGYSYRIYQKTVEELSGMGVHKVWDELADRVRSDIADYERKRGESPGPEMSMKEVREAARQEVVGRAPSPSHMIGQIDSAFKKLAHRK